MVKPQTIWWRISLFRMFTRIAKSLAKRLFWRRHLEDAIQQLETAKRELVSPEMFMAVLMLFRGKGYYSSMGQKQNMRELLGLVHILEQRDLKNVCEIGSFKGGTLFIWCQLAAVDAQIVSIDLHGSPFGGDYIERTLPLFQSFRKPSQQLVCLRGDSHDPEMRRGLEEHLRKEKLDFLFIDGDHTYDGVKRDFEEFSPYVKEGGIIAFHDIMPRSEHPEIQVNKFWLEIKKQWPYQEFIESDASRRTIGIGVLFKPKLAASVMNKRN
jgi:predicted O-methyltransferase YrrM